MHSYRLLVRTDISYLIVQEFAGYVHRREPLVIRLGATGLSSELRWNAGIFDDVHQLLQQSGDELVAVEIMNLTTSTNATKFGFGPSTLRRVMPFSRYVC